MHEIERLPLEEQKAVIRLVYRFDAERQLTGPELASFASRLADSPDPAEAMVLREEVTRGFYGGKPHA